MRPTWLIEAGVYGSEAESLLAEARRQGMPGAVADGDVNPFPDVLRDYLVYVQGPAHGYESMHIPVGEGWSCRSA